MGKDGSINEHRFTAHVRESLEENLEHYDDWGGFTTYNHYSWGWAWAGNTPHKLWKRYTWLGGTRTPLILHWPGRVAQPGTVRPQFSHAIDLLPTIMEAAGLELPDVVDGVPQQEVDGASLLPALNDPGAAEVHHTQYFEMMGSRSIYHEGWKATTNHISTGVLDEEELATGSRDFAEDRWELFDLTADFSEAIDKADDEPERVRQLRALWDAEAVRNNVLPISDGLVDRFAGFIPPTWPAGSSRVFLPGGGPVADESVPLLWGGFRLTADIDTGSGSPDGVVCALGDWFGGYALYVTEGRAHFTFARSYDVIELAAGGTLEPGAHELAVLYTLGEGGSPGRMALLVDGNEVDCGRRRREMLPLAVQHGGAGLRIGRDIGFPVSPALHPARAVRRHGAPGAYRRTRDAAGRPGGRGARRPARRLTAHLFDAARIIEGGAPDSGSPREKSVLTAQRAARVGQVLAGVTGGHRRQIDTGKDLSPGRAERRRPVQLLVVEPAQQRLEFTTTNLEQRDGLDRVDRLGSHGMGGVGPVDVLRRLGNALPVAHRLEPTRGLPVPLGDVVEHDAHRPVLSRHGRPPLVLAAAAGELDDLGVGRGEVVGQDRAALTRHARPRPPRSGTRSSTCPGAAARPRPGGPVARGGRSPAWGRRRGGPTARSRR